MRKFTLYQASRFTKISRYKLEQAIEDGLLTCIEGKGNVKCYINEDELNKFIDGYGEQYRRFTYPDETKQTFIADEMSQIISKEIHDQLMTEKDRVISLLEFQNSKLTPLLDAANIDTIKFNKLQSIAQEAISELPTEKNELKEQLSNRLSTI